MLILAWARTYGIPYIIVRPTNNYGVGQYVEKLIPKACKYLSLGRKIPLHNNGSPVRNWLHAEDTARAVLTIVDSGVRNEIYNICGGFEQTNLETIVKLLNAYGVDSKDLDRYIDWSCNRQGQDVRYALDDSKLRNLGWKPMICFDKALKPIVEHYTNTFVW
jgi:dTDP-glucose 4,6-dehydratase